MLNESEYGITRRPDIMPSVEAQREVSEDVLRDATRIKVNLAPQQFVRVGDGRDNVFVRRTAGIKVYGKEMHGGVEVITGILRLRGVRTYQVDVGEVGFVEIEGGEQCGAGRDFTISKPKGVAFATDGRLVPEHAEA